jgi:hypothetical protein
MAMNDTLFREQALRARYADPDAASADPLTVQRSPVLLLLMGILLLVSALALLAWAEGDGLPNKIPPPPRPSSAQSTYLLHLG